MLTPLSDCMDQLILFPNNTFHYGYVISFYHGSSFGTWRIKGDSIIFDDNVIANQDSLNKLLLVNKKVITTNNFTVKLTSVFGNKLENISCTRFTLDNRYLDCDKSSKNGKCKFSNDTIKTFKIILYHEDFKPLMYYKKDTLSNYYEFILLNKETQQMDFFNNVNYFIQNKNDDFDIIFENGTERKFYKED